MPPHHDIRTNKKLDESIFAADLAQVVRGNAPFDYQDPARFFATTYLSAGLSDLLRRVLREMAGTGTGNRIIQIDTPFGGGKTHTLLALYHLFTAPDRGAIAARNSPPSCGRGPARRAGCRGSPRSSAPKARRAAAVRIRRRHAGAHDLGPDRASTRRAATATNWCGRRTSSGSPPASARLSACSRQRPALILMDELVNYIVGAAGIAVGDATLKDQTI